MQLSLAICAFVISGWIDSLACASSPSAAVTFDDSQGFGRIFDGIGGLSGGGATSKLLVNYPTEQRDQILDYLFKPNFGASLQILKVEIGGDAQSTDGTEASHMHNSWDENYERGYEWWLMKEAKKRNPDIKLYGLPWGFPGWIGQGKFSPYTNINVTADYIVRWVNGAKTHHNLTIDFIGIWNERNYDVSYIKALRSLLNEQGFKNVEIIAADEKWEIASDILKDSGLASTISGIGCHYPGTESTEEAVKTGLRLWSSEDYSTFNDEVGGGCWARILNQNYVNGLMTATISWNLIGSYYKGLPYYRDGLMTAVQPWSGNYVVEIPIWMTAHTTQFSNRGWKYLSHGNGVGKLPSGGSYVALASPDNKNLTIVIETMTHDHSVCIRPPLPKYTVKPQTVVITLKGSYAAITEMNVWYSKLGFSGANSTLFVKKLPIKFKNGQASLKLGLDEMYTLTTSSGGRRGSYPPSPPPKPFPLPYKDDFEGYSVNQEPYNLAQQTGSFEVGVDGENKFIQQLVLEKPVSWCQAEKLRKSFNIIGDVSWMDIFVEIEFQIPAANGTKGVFVAARVDKGGCPSNLAHGIFFFAFPKHYILANDLARTRVIKEGDLPYGDNDWHKLSLHVEGTTAMGALDGKGVFNVTVPNHPKNGFAAIGTDTLGLANFDNLDITSVSDGQVKMKKYFKQADLHSLYFVEENP